MKTYRVKVEVTIEASNLGDAVSRVEKANTKSSSRENPGGSWVEHVTAEEAKR